MRFKEFVIVEQAAKFYTIGDSHAVAVAQAGGKDWVNLAIGGKSSTDSAMLANISKIPKGAVVLVSQGANDTANAMKAAEQTKKPPKDPQQIANNVANVVNKVEAQGATVIFLLFPNGPGRGPGLAKYYGGDYQEDVRKAIKSAIGNVTVIDLQGEPLRDGVHAYMGSYKEVANKVRARSGSGVTLGPGDSSPGKIPTKDKPASEELKKGPPYPIEDRKKVMQLQKSLEDLGYSVGPMGVDGKYGPYTANAVAAFKKDYKLGDDENTFDKVAFDTLSRVSTGLIAKVEPSQISVPGDTGAKTGDAIEALVFFIDKGWSGAQAAGIVGNLQAESGVNLKTNAVGDGGKAYGIAQWHPPRQQDFARVFKKDIRKSSFKEQLEFIHWELNNTEANAGALLRKAETAREAAIIVDQYYERSSGAHRQKRIQYAQALSSKTA